MSESGKVDQQISADLHWQHPVPMLCPELLAHDSGLAYHRDSADTFCE